MQTIQNDLFLGIDPGISGAWALIDSNKLICEAGLWHDRYDLIIELNKISKQIKSACLEKVHSMPRQGVSSTFTFGKATGYWVGLLESFAIPYVEVTPQKWQKAVLDACPTKQLKNPNETGKELSKRLKANRKMLKDYIASFVKRAFPDSREYLKLKKNYGIADAICMAEYVRTLS